MYIVLYSEQAKNCVVGNDKRYLDSLVHNFLYYCHQKNNKDVQDKNLKMKGIYNILC